MKKIIIVLCGLLFFAVSGSGQSDTQQTPPLKKKKTLTPEQQEFQRKLREYMAKRPDLQRRAKQFLDSEAGREKTAECPDAKSMYEINICFGNEAELTDQNLKGYRAIIGELISSVPDMPGPPTIGPTGAALTPTESAAEFGRVEEAWQQYRNVACKAARDQMGGGTAAPSSEMSCLIELDRSHMRELDSIYWIELHK